MTKEQLIDTLLKTCKHNGDLNKRRTNLILDLAFGAIAQSVKKEKRFVYPGFGIFTLKNRKGRTGRNPQTGETIQIRAGKTVKFKPAAALKGKL